MEESLSDEYFCERANHHCELLEKGEITHPDSDDCKRCLGED